MFSLLCLVGDQISSLAAKSGRIWCEFDTELVQCLIFDLPKAVTRRRNERGGQLRDFNVVKQVSTPMARRWHTIQVTVYYTSFCPCSSIRFDWDMAFCGVLVVIVIQVCPNLVNDLPNLRLKWMQMQTPQADGIRWVLMDRRPRPNIEHHVSSCFNWAEQSHYP